MDTEQSDEFLELDLSAGHWGTVPESLVSDPRLGHAAARVGVWLSIRPRTGWKVFVGPLRAACGSLGKDAWHRARQELIQAGYLRVTKSRVAAGRFGRPRYVFNPRPTGAGFTGSGGAGAGRTGAGPTGCLSTPSSTKPSNKKPTTTTRATRARPTAGLPAGGGAVGNQEGDPGALMVARLAAAAAVPSACLARVAAAARGSSLDQASAAAEAILAAAARPGVRDIAAYAISLAGRAARGEVSKASPKPDEIPIQSINQQIDVWAEREKKVGWEGFDSLLGRVKVEPGAKAWKSTNGYLSGATCLELWDRVERGVLALTPPSPTLSD